MQTSAKLVERIPRAQDIESFRFLSQEKIPFKPGQFAQLIFDRNNPGNKDLNKYLSFSSSPTKDYLEVTKKLSDSSFSQKLKDLKIGNEVLLKAPLGTCVLEDDYEKISFLIGGIGITPVISIIEYIIERKLNTDVVLFYSNRTEDIPFKKELDSWQKLSQKIRIVYLISDCQPKDNKCIAGSISKDLLIDKIEDFRQRVLFSFGPPAMTKAMEKICLSLGCNQAMLKVESFLGY